MDETTETSETQAPVTDAPAQDTKDWKSESRKWEARAKENKEKADQYDAMQQSSLANADQAKEAEKRASEAEKRATEAEQFAEQAKAELTRMQTLSTVSEETGVPVSLLHGETEEEIRDYARSILDFSAHTKPSIPKDQGGSAGKPTTTRESIESIKDPVERVRARAANINLYQ